MLQVPLGTEYRGGQGFKFQISGFKFQVSNLQGLRRPYRFFFRKGEPDKNFKGIEFQKALLGHAGPVYLEGVEIEFFELPQSLAGPAIVDDLCKKPHSLLSH
jgi:hypothetical protein